MHNQWQYQIKSEPVLVDITFFPGWYVQASEPVRKGKNYSYVYPMHVLDTVLPPVTLDEWFMAATEPLAVKANRCYHLPFFLDPTVPIVTLDKWFQPLSESVRLKKDVSYSYPSYVSDPTTPAFAEIITLDKWFQLPSEPLRTSKDIKWLYPEFVIDSLYWEVLLDRWFMAASEPVRVKPFTVKGSQVAYEIPWSLLTFVRQPLKVLSLKLDNDLSHSIQIWGNTFTLTPVSQIPINPSTEGDIVLYKNGSEERMYFYINSQWRYVSIGVYAGYTYYNPSDGGVYRFLGGTSTDPLNWILVGGEMDNNPDTSTWGVKQKGAKWYNRTDQQWYGWNGDEIVILG